MAKHHQYPSESDSGKTQRRKAPPALTPEGRENQMISLAMDLAEEQLRNGTASSQVITHYLKLGSLKEKTELEKAKKDVLLTQAKIEALQSQKQVEELYANAIAAMRSYGGAATEGTDVYED